MTNDEKLNEFSTELKNIKNAQIKTFSEEAIKLLPDYFFKVAASSTGKYHPKYALGEGGLLRHTKAAVKIALELFNNHTLQNFTDDEKDLIIISLILHDGFKHGLKESKYTVADHPVVMAKFLKTNKKLTSLLNETQLKLIIYSIASHMGEWNTDFRTKKEIMPKPKTKIQSFVHLCDYLASRKSIEIIF